MNNLVDELQVCEPMIPVKNQNEALVGVSLGYAHALGACSSLHDRIIKLFKAIRASTSDQGLWRDFLFTSATELNRACVDEMNLFVQEASRRHIDDIVKPDTLSVVDDICTMLEDSVNIVIGGGQYSSGKIDANVTECKRILIAYERGRMPNQWSVSISRILNSISMAASTRHSLGIEIERFSELMLKALKRLDRE